MAQNMYERELRKYRRLSLIASIIQLKGFIIYKRKYISPERHNARMRSVASARWSSEVFPHSWEHCVTRLS